LPELPEVEVTRQGIAPFLVGQVITGVAVRHPRLRWPIPRTLARVLPGQTIMAVRRRAKYLLIDMPAGTLVLHLGMSGSLRILTQPTPPGAHDHFDLYCTGGMLRLNDPRRFGAVLWQPAGGQLSSQPGLLERLGLEPFDPAFTATVLWQRTRGRAMAIKQVLLAGEIVVGVGNIYASESLFRAGIHPQRPAGRISAARYERLAKTIREVLQEAIAQGGSTLRDFVDSRGAPGYFQQAHQVYGRTGAPCVRCGAAIRQITQGQRSTWFCPRCQR
jgi:formamidopyrimidine-DNA glycosylase